MIRVGRFISSDMYSIIFFRLNFVFVEFLCVFCYEVKGNSFVDVLLVFMVCELLEYM